MPNAFMPNALNKRKSPARLGQVRLDKAFFKKLYLVEAWHLATRGCLIEFYFCSIHQL